MGSKAKKLQRSSEGGFGDKGTGKSVPGTLRGDKPFCQGFKNPPEIEKISPGDQQCHQPGAKFRENRAGDVPKALDTSPGK